MKIILTTLFLVLTVAYPVMAQQVHHAAGSDQLGLFSEGVVHWPTIFSGIVLASFLLACSEEKKVIVQFWEEYLEYKARVPMFIPRRGQWKEFVESLK